MPPEALGDHARDNLRYIRQTMERAGSFTSIPGWGGFAVGVTALLATALAQPLTALQPRDWLLLWLAEAALATSIGWPAMALKGKRAGVSLISGVAKRFFISYLAPMIAGAVLTFALFRAGAFQPMPSVWLLLYGTAIVSSGAFSLRVVPIMGACFMILGFIAAFLPLSLANIVLGAGFGGLHVIFGSIIARNYGG